MKTQIMHATSSCGSQWEQLPLPLLFAQLKRAWLKPNSQSLDSCFPSSVSLARLWRDESVYVSSVSRCHLPLVLSFFNAEQRKENTYIRTLLLRRKDPRVSGTA